MIDRITGSSLDQCVESDLDAKGFQKPFTLWCEEHRLQWPSIRYHEKGGGSVWKTLKQLSQDEADSHRKSFRNKLKIAKHDGFRIAYQTVREAPFPPVTAIKKVVTWKVELEDPTPKDRDN